MTAVAPSRPIEISGTGTLITPLQLSNVRITSAAMPRSNCRSDPAKLLGGNASGVLARVIEGWQVSTVFDMSTGAPLNVGATTTINRTGTPDIVGEFPRKGQVSWGDPFGNYFADTLYRVTDPACTAVASNLTQFCSNTAIATDAAGTNIILQNAAPASWARWA